MYNLTRERHKLRVRYWPEPIGYAEAYDIQMRLWAQVVAGETTDALLLLQHPPTFTMGKRGGLENLLVGRERLAEEGLGLFFTDRGGDITYHGPGQLVVYPIVDLRRRGKDVHAYVHRLEEVAVRALADLSIAARRDERCVGVWVGEEKIAAIGVRVRRWVTMHGLALNVDPALEHFAYINPCGMVDCRVTSVARVLGRQVNLDEVAGLVLAHFTEVFSADVDRVNDLGGV